MNMLKECSKNGSLKDFLYEMFSEIELLFDCRVEVFNCILKSDDGMSICSFSGRGEEKK